MGESPRNSMLHNIDESRNISALRVGDWKMVKGTTYGGQWDSWYGPDGRKDQPYNFEILYNSPTAKSLKKIGMELPIKSKVTQLRKDSQLKCVKNKGKKFLCHPLQQICLFNITADPCEYNNL